MSLRASRRPSLICLKSLLDYALAESAELDLPLLSRLLGGAALAVEDELRCLAVTAQKAAGRGKSEVVKLVRPGRSAKARTGKIRQGRLLTG
jgi:hypothetical protein